MNTNSNSYTVIYASILVIIVAFLLAFVSSSLKETQEENVRLDTKKQILSSLGITPDSMANANLDAAAVYNDVVKGDYLLSGDELVEYNGEFRTKYTGKNEETNEDEFHVFKCEINGETKYVFPVRGAGLWGPIWGYIALNEDKNTVYGTYFGHEGETPGLGAEIVKPFFTDQFKGKLVFDKSMDANTVELGVEKNGKVTKQFNQVDGISGGTITSKGVDLMIKTCLTRYVPFLTKNCDVKAEEPAPMVSDTCPAKDSLNAVVDTTVANVVIECTGDVVSADTTNKK